MKKDKGKGKNVAASTEIDDFASQFDQEFSFMASTSTSVAPSSRIWYVDSGASRHMTGDKPQWHHPHESGMLIAGLPDI